MGVIQMDFLAESLNIATSVHIILPMPRHAGVQVKPLPTLILLHGMGDDDSAWLRKTNIERFATEAGLAVIMPDGELSCYENMVHGQKYADFITKELPAVMRACFPLSDRRDENFIAGCSMGGFGALKIGLARPENYAAIGCFSAAIMEYRPESAFVKQALWRVYDDDIDFNDVIMAANARATAAYIYPVRIWHGWGEDDRLRENAEKTRAFFEGIQSPSLSYQWEMLPGQHDWALWDEMAKRFIPWLNLPKAEEMLF